VPLFQRHPRLHLPEVPAAVVAAAVVPQLLHQHLHRLRYNSPTSG
jgi:hypothetical protein